MTEFKILRDHITIGFEMYTQEGVSHRYSAGVILRGPFPGKFPLQPDDVKVLITEKRPDRREEKR